MPIKLNSEEFSNDICKIHEIFEDVFGIEMMRKYRIRPHFEQTWEKKIFYILGKNNEENFCWSIEIKKFLEEEEIKFILKRFLFHVKEKIDKIQTSREIETKSQRSLWDRFKQSKHIKFVKKSLGFEKI